MRFSKALALLATLWLTPVGAQLLTTGAGSVAGGSAIPLWTPLNLSIAPAAWWDANSGVALSGSNVTSWTDRISSRVASQGTAINQPLYSATALNGKPGLTFPSDGNPHGLTFNATGLPTGATSSVIAVAALGVSNGTINKTFIYWGTVSSNAGRVLGFNNNSTQDTWFSTVSVIDQITTTSWAANLFNIATFDSNLVNSTVVTQWIDGVLVGNNTIATTPLTSGVSGAIGTLSQTLLSGNIVGTIQQILVLSVILNTNQRQCLEGWESWYDGKAGSNLPAGHPYKSAAPTTSSSCS